MNPVYIFSTAANAVLPIVLLIFLGAWLRKTGFFTDAFLKVGNAMVFNLCLPAMLFVNVYNIDSIRNIQWGVVAFAVGFLILLFLIAIPIAMITTKVPQRRGVLVQGIFRSNTAIIGLSMAAALGGEDAVATASLVAAFSIPVINILAVISLTMFLPQSGGSSWKRVLTGIAKNPLIRAILLGLGCLLIRELQRNLWGDPLFTLSGNLPFLYTSLNHLKSVTTPLALLVLGGQFMFSAARELWKEILVGTLGRTVFAPALCLSLAILFYRQGLMGIGISAFPSLISLSGTPCAASGAIMASQTGNDQQLATQLILWSSILSIFTLFITICLMMAMGYIIV